MSRRRRLLLWGGVGVTVVVALVLGSVRPSSPPTAARRIAAVEAAVRCPSCEGLSVAGSSAPSAVHIRDVVAADVHAGMTDRQIEAGLQAHYPAILLRPPVSGAVGLVWLVPLLAGAGALAGLGAFYWRRRRASASASAEPGSAPAHDDDRLLVQRALDGSRA